MTKLKHKLTKADYPTAWGDRPISRERWRRHRERIIETEAVFGQRPAEWWRYELNEDVPDDHEATVLYERGHMLREDETEYLLAYWREQYARTQEPDFGHCIGHAKPDDASASWVYGAEARRLHIAWAGIPSSLVVKWDAEKLDEKRKTGDEPILASRF